MRTAVQLASMVGPLTVYLYVIAVWQSGRHPRIVSGFVDLALLLFGLSGLVLFGPVGRLLLVRAGAGPFGAPSLWAWLALASSLSLLAVPWLPRSFRRLVIYNVDRDSVNLALRNTLQALPGDYAPTLRGFEDRKHHRGLSLEITAWGRTAVIEAYGDDPESLIVLVRQGLSVHLQPATSRPSPVAWALLGLCMALIGPVLVVLLSRPQTRAALRALMERLHGG
jgi:hypothetical protein